MAQITSYEELKEWLIGKPREFGQVIAARAALFAVPYAFDESTPLYWIKKNGTTLFRAVTVAWATHNVSDYDSVIAIENSSKSVRYTHYGTSSVRASARVMRLAAEAISGAIQVHDNVIYDAANGPEAISYAIGNRNDQYAFWDTISDYCDWLDHSIDPINGVRSLMSQPLWWRDASRSWDSIWHDAAKRLLALDPTYQVWIDWYNRRIEGHDAAFDIPGDTDRVDDKKILARLANATDKDFWDKGATYVNTTLQGWIDEARERVRQSEAPNEPPPPTPEAIRAVAAEIASPNVTLTNNQLDVTTNTAFDSQTDAANLDEAIAVLRAVVGALLGGLPGNAPRSFAANLTIYDGELAKRDAKPFLGVLVRMEKSVSAGFHADPEMFDAGVTTNFESYFDAHLAFMTHYRRNEAREAKIAQFTIDDAAASGVALTGPVDEVVKEVDTLAEQGLVTDGFVQAIKEQKAINDEVALYASSVPAISGDPTVKARHILQTVGFYERTLAIAANTIAVTTQFAVFIIVLKTAIEALLKFFV